MDNDISIQDELSLLRTKLGRLGVDLALSASRVAGSEVLEAALSEEKNRSADKEKDALLDLLHRCNNVQRIIEQAEVGSSAAADYDALRKTKAALLGPEMQLVGKKKPSSASSARPKSSRAAPAAAAALHRSPGPARPAAAAAAAASSRLGPKKPWMPPGLDGLEASMARDGSMNRMIQRLQEEIKIMQEDFTQREATLRRDAELWRKKSLKQEKEIDRLHNQVEGRVMELKAARAALGAREERLAQVERRARDQDETVIREKQSMLRQLEDVGAERDDLKALLAATLKRLESVDEAVRSADLSQAVMEERVRTLELEREKALNELSATRSELGHFTDAHRTLQHEHEILDRLTRVNQAKNEARKEALKEALAGTHDLALAEGRAREGETSSDLTESDGDSDSVSDVYGLSARQALGIPPSLRGMGGR